MSMTLYKTSTILNFQTLKFHYSAVDFQKEIEYDPLTDRYVGFVLPLKDGLPICDAYMFGTFQEISHAYKACAIAKYAHVIVAKPITVDTPSFVLAVLGTDSKYDSTIISKRWAYMKDQLSKRNIKIVSYGAERDLSSKP